MAICGNCGEQNPDRFKLCGFCGTPLVQTLPAHEVRKTVTIVFSDLKGSTSLGEALDSESLREVLTRYFEEMRAALEEHGGTVEKYIGDAVMAVFGLPTLHEDDALRAVRAAAGMQAALARVNEELERVWGVRLTNRTGVNTGEVVAGDPVAGQRLVTGDAVNVAARLEQAAGALEVLIGEPTYRLVRDFVDVEPVDPLELKGKSERVPAYRLVGVREQQAAPAQGPVRPLVGRDEELEQLRVALGEAVTAASPRLATVVADAGVGKSRLIEELARTVAGQAQILRGRCLAYGRGITFWPVRELLHQAAEIAPSDAPDVAIAKLTELAGEDVAARLAGAVGLSERQFPVDEVFWGVRQLFERLADRGPVVFLVEDVHWGEQTLLDLLEHLCRSCEAPLLIVAATRPTLFETRPTWGEQERARRIELRPLSAEHSTAVVSNLLQGSDMLERLVARIVEAADGNPLYVEQLLAYTLEEGEAAIDSLPPTIDALLSARLDSLNGHERSIVECASVIGLVFAHAAVHELVPEAVQPTLNDHLASLEAKRLIHRDLRSQDLAWKFDHALIRDAAYGALLKRSRATLHERFADWAEGLNRDRDRETEFEEILGYHLEQAHDYLAELGPLDDRGRELGARGATRLGSAGRRAFARGDMSAASNLLRRAASLLDVEDLRRLELLPELGEALMETGEFAWAEVFLDQAVEGARAHDRTQLEADAILTRLLVRHHAASDLEAWRNEVDAETQRLIPILEREAADYELAKAWRMVAFVHGSVCRWEQVAAAQQRALEHARRAARPRQEARASSALTMALRDGPTPVAEAIAHCEKIIEAGLIDRQAEALVLCSLSYLEGMRGNFDYARELYARARTIFLEVGAAVLAAGTSLTSGRIELLAGNAVEAEDHLRRGYDALGEMGERYLRPLVGAVLAQALYVQGKFAEAGALAEEARELADEDDIETQGLWRAVAAQVRAADGDVEDAEVLARESVELLRQTDAPVMQADMLLHLGMVLKDRGQLDEARAVLEEASGLYRDKGVIPADARAGELLAELARPERTLERQPM
jgi:class 3 adenylate cyclase/tetratricopeptide (TPR) repeat protein